MKRDDEYIRNILLELEGSDSPFLQVAQTTWSPSDHDQKNMYHIELLCDVGYLQRHSQSQFRLTSQGHDYLESIRDETIWNKTKEGAAKVGGVSISFMKEIALGYIRQKLIEEGVPL